MTNPTFPDICSGLPPELRALAPVGGRRRPVGKVEHPAFRAARARATVALCPVPATAGACHPSRPAAEAA